MKRWKQVIIFLLSFLVAGCAHYDIPMVEIDAPPPEVIHKLPLKAAIQITGEMENYIFTGKDPIGQTYTFQLGQIIKDQIFNMLSPGV